MNKKIIDLNMLRELILLHQSIVGGFMAIYYDDNEFNRCVLAGRMNLFIGTVLEDMPQYKQKDYLYYLKVSVISIAFECDDKQKFYTYCMEWVAEICGAENRCNDENR